MTYNREEVIGLASWWWVLVVRGLVGIGFGVLAFLAPLWGITILVALFAAWSIIDGIGNLLTGIRTRNQDRSWWLEILEGLVGVAAGILAIFLPVLFTAQVLVLIIAAWAGITGLIEIVLAIRLRRVITGEIWMALAGVASIVFGILLVVFPGTGALSLVWLIGSFAILFGIFQIALGWRLRTTNEMARIDAAHDYSR